MPDRLAGRFSLLYRDENSILVGFVGNVTAESLSYEELRRVSLFYIDGEFIINSAQILSKDDPVAKKSKYPVNNYNSILRVCYVSVKGFSSEEYTEAKLEEERLGVEWRRSH